MRYEQEMLFAADGASRAIDSACEKVFDSANGRLKSPSKKSCSKGNLSSALIPFLISFSLIDFFSAGYDMKSPSAKVVSVTDTSYHTVISCQQSVERSNHYNRYLSKSRGCVRYTTPAIVLSILLLI